MCNYVFLKKKRDLDILFF